MHDEERYPNPNTFDPLRFLTADGQLRRDVPDPTEVFGFGRRICPGRYFAEEFSWLAMASVLTTFNIDRPRDGSGSIVEIKEEFTNGSMRYVCQAMPAF